MTIDSQFDFTDFAATYGKEEAHLIMHLAGDEASIALMFTMSNGKKDAFGLRINEDDIELESFGFNFNALAAFVDAVRAIETLDEK